MCPQTIWGLRWENWTDIFRLWSKEESSWRGIWESARTVQLSVPPEFRKDEQVSNDPSLIEDSLYGGRVWAWASVCDVSDQQEEQMLLEWFSLVREKNSLVRRDTELIYLWVLLIRDPLLWLVTCAVILWGSDLRFSMCHRSFMSCFFFQGKAAKVRGATGWCGVSAQMSPE